MPLAFPLSRAAFFDRLPIDTAPPPRLSGGTVHSQTRGGEIIPVDLGVRLWQGEVTLRSMPHHVAADLDAQLELLQAGAGSFIATPWPYIYPLADHGGVLLGSTVPELSAISAQNREIRLSGLPAGYPISAGTFLSFSYGTSPVRHALHRAVTGVVASGGGLTPLIEVVPPIRSGALIGADVTLIRPFFKAVVVPGSVNFGQTRGNRRSGMSFKYIQTLR